jgi:hypothetical protein
VKWIVHLNTEIVDGRTAGGFFNRDDSRSGTPRVTERAGGVKPTREYNRYTTTLDGPII